MSFLHGVETITLPVAGRTITVAKTAVIMLVGYAPKGPAQTLTLVQSDSDASQFGKFLNGFTIPQALDIIFNQGGATVVVCNVYDSTANDASVTAEAHTLVAGKTSTTYHPTNAVVVKNSGGSTTYVKDTDYTIDEYGNITVIGTTIGQTDVIKCTYKYFDATTVSSSQINGSVSGDTKTGIELFANCKAQFGFTGKILICPIYGSITAVSTKITSFVNSKRAFAYIHAPYGTSKANAITGRGVSGTINFQNTNKRVMLVFPYVKDLSPVDGSSRYWDLSTYYAAMRAWIDVNEGPHRSVSNHEMIGPNGSEIIITDEINDANSDANTLGALGISTVSMGTGAPLTWGNRNASYPNNTAIDSFECIIRMSDIIDEAIEYYSRPFVDKDITKAVIDQIRDDINNFLRVWISRGWLIDGKVTWSKADNPNNEMAAGHLVFRKNFLPPPPLERITYYSTVDISMFSKIV